MAKKSVGRELLKKRASLIFFCVFLCRNGENIYLCSPIQLKHIYHKQLMKQTKIHIRTVCHAAVTLKM